MEIETRFFYDLSEYDSLNSKLKSNDGLQFEGCFFEKTLQYDNPNPSLTFYSKEIDGRFRLRTSTNIETKESNTKLSWKRRTKDNFVGGIHREEEVELAFKSKEEADNALFLIEQVLKMPKVESYERYRNVYIADGVEIVVDKFPFAVALEIECKDSSEEKINEWCDKLNLDINKSYSLSWDDKYKELCEAKNEVPQKFVEF